jgi:hypothetical protein
MSFCLSSIGIGCVIYIFEYKRFVNEIRKVGLVSPSSSWGLNFIIRIFSYRAEQVLEFLCALTICISFSFFVFLLQWAHFSNVFSSCGWRCNIIYLDYESRAKRAKSVTREIKIIFKIFYGLISSSNLYYKV